LSRFYANITLKGSTSSDVATYLSEQHESAYVSPSVKDAVVVFHEDMQNQEALAAKLSAHFSCPALLVMAYAEIILLYHLYQNGAQTDAYVSSPHGDLELESPAPPGNASVLCAAFEADRFERRVESILRKEGKPDQPFANAINRHGELFQALGLPVFAAGASFQSIEIGEMPAGKGFDAGAMVRTK
jgi:hypothetical protein